MGVLDWLAMDSSSWTSLNKNSSNYTNLVSFLIMMNKICFISWEQSIPYISVYKYKLSSLLIGFSRKLYKIDIPSVFGFPSAIEWWALIPIIYDDNSFTHPFAFSRISLVVKPQWTLSSDLWRWTAAKTQEQRTDHISFSPKGLCSLIRREISSARE